MLEPFGNAGSVEMSPLRLSTVEPPVDMTQGSEGMPPPPAPWSCRAERSEAETSPRARRERSVTPRPWDLSASPARLDRPASLRGGLSTPGPAGPFGRDDVLVYRGCCVLWGVLCSVRSASAARFWSCRAERREVETPPWACRSRSGMLGPFGDAGAVEVSPRRLGVEALVETTLVRGGMLCPWGVALPYAPRSCRAER